MKTSAELREAFLAYFEQKKHQRVPSSSLVPANDPTLLFTNAGMVQFKDVFLGQDQRTYQRATSSQRCVRAGGKHNDLENVGYTARHHTFFEMLGNFSFGDYFKQDAIHFAWEFLTKVVGLPVEKLWVTVYEEDKEAERIWFEEIGIDPARFSRCGAKDNFWSMGETGPCGPCSEIFYDHGEDIWGGPPASADEDGDRYIEIWNLVFMQYDRNAAGELNPLPHPSVDTGMGLERLAAVLQGVHNNYDIDLFQHLIKAASKLTNTTDLSNKSLRVIADHIRSCSFLILDGVIPSNEGRSYVLRRIIRRAVRHGYQLGCTDHFFHKLVKPLIEVMGDAYPDLKTAQPLIEDTLKREETRFAETLEQGMAILNQAIKQMQGTEISGDVVFKLYDTFGFPVDLTADIAREKKLTLDMDGYQKAMQKQRAQSKEASQFSHQQVSNLDLDGETTFTGYQQTQTKSVIRAIYQQDKAVSSLSEGEIGRIILEETPFYAESGGQIGDTGIFESESGTYQVEDCQKNNDLVVHIGKMSQGTLKVGDSVNALIDQHKRQQIKLNHSATHLMHAALRQILGTHVAQKGSLVTSEKLRFDFSHHSPISQDEIYQIEQLVNQQIRCNHIVETNIMSLDEAKETGAMALFGEKYSQDVRVLKMGDFSTELCGGTHVNAIGDIGLFKIIHETGIASGVRRIEAVTGEGAMKWIEAEQNKLQEIANLVRSSVEDSPSKVRQLTEKTKQLEKQLNQLNAKLASAAGSDLASQSIEINGIKTLAVELKGIDPKTLRDTMDQLKNKLGSAVILLAAESNGRVSLIAGVTKDLTQQYKAGDLVKQAAEKVSGKGGGRPDMAQAGGTDPAGIPAALNVLKSFIEQTPS